MELAEMVVWVLMIFAYGATGGGRPVVIDNIATAESCKQLAEVVRNAPSHPTVICAPVRKAVTK